MGRWLSVDYGTKRTGLAVTDPLRIIASPLEGVRTHDLFDYLENYFNKEQVEKIIVGYPTRDDGSPTTNTPHVEAFVKRFKKVFPSIPLVLHDEWNTSNDAVRSMVASGTKKKNRRDKIQVDVMSATIILQSYMEQEA